MMVDVDISGPVAAIDSATVALENPRVGPMADAYKAVGELSIEYARKEFDRNSPGGGDWVALAPSTVKKKGHSRILVEDGDLRRSLNKSGKNQVLRLTGSGVDAGTADPKANFHQQGGANLPRRVVLPKLNSEVKGKGLTVLSDATLRVLKAAAGPAAPQAS